MGPESSDAETLAKLVVAFADVTRSNAEMSTAISAATRDAAKSHQTCTRLQFLIGVLVALNAFQFYANDHDKAEILTSSVNATQIALEAKNLAYLSEASAEQFREDQTQFNETVLQAFEEIKRKIGD